MPQALDVRGQRFGRLVAIQRTKARNRRTFWVFFCDCGTVKETGLAHVMAGRVRSCGCLLDEHLHSDARKADCMAIGRLPRKHGMSRTPVHAVWKTMRQRCNNPRNFDYRFYGALGVRICQRWDSFSNFYADMGEPNGLTLDRIDPTGHYAPGNCRWATWETQRTNKREATNG